MNSGLSEVARFLALRAPFASLPAAELGELAQRAELEFYAAGAAILTEDGGPVTFLRVIHSGAVDIVHDGRLLDLLGPGDTFGHAAMLAGLPPGFEARAAEDTLSYRIPVAAARPLLDRARERELAPAAGDPSHRAVGTLIRAKTVCCGPRDHVAAVARRMTEAGASAAIVELGGAGAMGIVTDSDLRGRVVATGLPGDTPVERVMTAPVFAVTPDRLGGEVLFELLERGVHHAPVVTASGRLVGVVEDGDLLAVPQRAWFGARRVIGRAAEADELAAAARVVPELIADLHAAELGASEVARVRSALLDALVVRALELAGEQAPLANTALVWVALGSQSRRELTPAAAPLGAAICDRAPPPTFERALKELLAAAGLPAEFPPVRTAAHWLASATDEPLARAVATDRRVLYGTPAEPLPVLDDAVREPVLAALKAAALTRRAPTGFAAAGVVAAGGELAGAVDVQAMALQPIATIAGWAGAAAGETSGSTPERLRAAAAAGVLTETDAGDLADAFAVALGLAVGHEIAQLASGRPPDAPLDAATLRPFMREELRHVFRTVAAVQRRLAQPR